MTLGIGATHHHNYLLVHTAMIADRKVPFQKKAADPRSAPRKQWHSLTGTVRTGAAWAGRYRSSYFVLTYGI